MKNVLLIAPHPDDEIVGAFMIIKKILTKKSIVFFLTNGIINKNLSGFGKEINTKKKLKKEKEMKQSINC